MNDLVYWIWLAEKNGAGHSDANKLLKKFVGGAKAIYEATYEQLISVSDCSPTFIRRLMDHDLSSAERILEFCFLNGIRILSCMSPGYPRRLNTLRNKPIVLYTRGDIEDLDDRFCVSIVGTRNMSGYGKHITFMIARQLIAYGAIIISGAAYGIDSAANNTSIFMEEPTVAVLGSGVNVPYPAKNKEMLDYIAKTGMVISEFPPNTVPAGKNFPIRNRIISGLADAVVVVEAGERSGALITARCAEEQGRRVYAVPGNLGVPNSIGTNNMIRDGAKMVTRAEDIIEDFAEYYNLSKIDRIINGEKYLRYEYNHKIPILPENIPLSRAEQDKYDNMLIPKFREKKSEQLLSPAEPAAFKQEERREPPVTAEYPKAPKAHEIRKLFTRPIGSVFGASAEKKAADVERKNTSENSHADKKETGGSEKNRIIDLLGDAEKEVLAAIPEGIAVTTDKIAQAGIPTAQVMSSLTVLELYEAVEALPGGLYKRLI